MLYDSIARFKTHCLKVGIITHPFFLRLLGMSPAKQQPLFSFFLGVLKSVVDEAKRNRAYDGGIQDVQGVVTLDEEPRVVFTVR